MASETNLLGVIEFYDRNNFDKLFEFINHSLKDNFFNIRIHKTHLNNRGSILVPFAKCFRSDFDDEVFLLQKLDQLISALSFIEMFAIEIYVDSAKLKNQCYRILVGNGKYEMDKFKIEFHR